MAVAASLIRASIDTLSCNSEWVALEKIIAKVAATNATIPKQTVRILVWRMVNAGELVKKFVPFGRKDAYEVKRIIRAFLARNPFDGQILFPVHDRAISKVGSARGRTTWLYHGLA